MTLEQRLFEGIENTLARILGVTASDYTDVLDNRYFFIGVTERLQQSFDRLAGILKKPRIAIPRHNAADRDDTALSTEVITVFGQRNSLDYHIYQYCCDRLERELSNSD